MATHSTARAGPCRSNRSLFSSLASSITITLLLATVFAASAKADSFPSIDFQGLGNVGIAGAFDGIAVWQPNLATNNESNVYNSNASSLIIRDANGILSKINETGEGGRIQAICQTANEPHTVYVGGSFSQIAGMNASNIAAYDPSRKVWDALEGGVDGEVLSLFCDDPHSLVYAGGSFSHPKQAENVTRYLGAVASWNYTSKAWLPVPFGGLNGSVTDITRGVNASTLRFAGAFSTDFSSAVGSRASISGTNSSASPLSVAFSPLPLGQSEFQGGPSSSNDQFNNPAQILCPQGDDGADNTYLFADDAPGRLTMRAFRNLPTRAIRLGNTFVDGRGTRTFGIISIPDNTQLELLYLDPQTQQNVTCTTDCPLFHNPAVPYQDFLITDNPANGVTNGVKQLTGIQFTANSWHGKGAGLHLLQLLTDGTMAYAYPGYNRATCESNAVGAASSRASSSRTGAWYYSTVRSSTTNTLEPVLALSDDYSKLRNNLDARVTWTLDVPYDGNYSAYMFVPGCEDGGQCNVRTDVQARLINNATTAAQPANWTRVPQTNPKDASVLIFSGPVSKSSGSFRPTIELSIPEDAPRPSGSDRFSVYADRVSLELINSNELHQYYVGRGIGLLEYNVYDPTANNNSLAFSASEMLQSKSVDEARLQSLLPSLYNGTQALPNSTMTPMDFFSVTLANEGVRQNESESVSVIEVVGNRTFIGGSFSSNNVTNTTGFANLVSYYEANGGTSYLRVAGGGLNGPVNAMAQANNFLFIGGDFTATSDNATAISYAARYDPATNVWASLGQGVDGPVRDMTVVGTQILFVGSFTAVNGTTNQAGVGLYDPATNQWVAQPEPVVGLLTAVSSLNNATYLVGQVESVGSMPADAAVQVSAPSEQGNYPNLTALNFKFPDVESKAREVPPTAKAAANARRNLLAKSTNAELHYNARILSDASSALAGAVEKRGSNRSLLSRLASRATEAILPRSEDESPSQLSSLFKRADVMDVPSLNTNGANEILCSAFWKRNETSVMNVLGGNFTTSSGVRNLGIYDPDVRQLIAFPAMPKDSNLTVVRSVYVDGDTLYVGGDGGVLRFDLSKALWSDLPALTAQAGTVLSVRAIGHRPNFNTMVIAGTFTSAGGLPCKNVCQWDTQNLRWISAGNGIDGNIAALDFAGNKANTLVLAGSLNVGGREAALASWQFDTSEAVWTALGAVGTGPDQVSGPATAVSVDNLNANAIFVAGRSDDGKSPYLARWDGVSYAAVGGDELLASSGIAQLSFVGLTRPHPDNAILESNRMLVVSGALGMKTYGNVSSALFDGQAWTPFVLTTKEGGGSGVVRAFTRSVEVLNFMNLHRLPVGIVILISIAIGLGIVFLLVLLGLVWALVFRRKRDQGVVPVPVHESEETLAGGAAGEKATKRRPSSLLATLNKATENVIGEHKQFAAAGAAAGAAGIAGVGAGSSSHHDHSGTSSYGHGGAVATTSHGHDESGVPVLPSSQNHSDETGAGAQSSQYHSDGQTGQSGVSRYYSGDEGMPSVAAGTAAAAAVASGKLSHEDAQADGIEAHARYTFEATHASELGVQAGDRIWILDDQDEHWWLARNADGKTGVLPASYVL